VRIVQRLGRLYNQLDYPHTLRELFQVAWDFPSVEAPPYLEQLSPERDRYGRVVAFVYAGDTGHSVQQAMLEQHPYSIAIIDWRMPPGWDGVDTAMRIWTCCPELQVILCAAPARCDPAAPR
jgi:hypothetical protein